MLARKLVFDVRMAEDLKRRGMDTAVSNRSELFTLARQVAVWLTELDSGRTVTIDGVQETLILLGYEPSDLGNAAGRVFHAHPRFEAVGWQKSTRVSNHARPVRVWRLER